MDEPPRKRASSPAPDPGSVAAPDSPTGPVDIVLTGAGAGARLGSPVPKAFVEVAGRPLVAHALEAASAVEPRRVAITVPEAGAADWIRRVRDLGSSVRVIGVAGGATRQESVRRGLEALAGAADETGEPGPELVLVHDAARPCASPALWRRVLESARATGAAVPVLPAVDCLKRVDASGRVEATLDRERIVRVQTPQGFRWEWLWEAHRSDGGGAPDDAALVEGRGRTVATVEGEPRNLKVTRPEDLRAAARALGAAEGLGPGSVPAGRVGHGWDVHRLVEGRRLVLGGVEIAHRSGLAGHSDADVLAHAITDALLGAAGLGDIGSHFPDDDPRWKDSDSLELLGRVVDLVRESGHGIANVDATVRAEEPRLAPHVEPMRHELARVLGVPVEQVSVKATTGEGVGPVGRGEAIVAEAVALLLAGER